MKYDKVKTICFDLDGVLHRYSRGWQDGEIYDIPMEGSREKIRLLMDRGFEIVVFTARDDLRAVRKWLKNNGFPKLKVTNRKVPAIAYVDDRAIRFTNFEDIVKYFI